LVKGLALASPSERSERFEPFVSTHLLTGNSVTRNDLQRGQNKPTRIFLVKPLEHFLHMKKYGGPGRNSDIFLFPAKFQLVTLGADYLVFA
jgi:hypothetical protein